MNLLAKRKLQRQSGTTMNERVLTKTSYMSIRYHCPYSLTIVQWSAIPPHPCHCCFHFGAGDDARLGRILNTIHIISHQHNRKIRTTGIRSPKSTYPSAFRRAEPARGWRRQARYPQFRSLSTYSSSVKADSCHDRATGNFDVRPRRLLSVKRDNNDRRSLEMIREARPTGLIVCMHH